MRWLRLKALRDIRRRRDQVRKWLDAHPRVDRFLERTGCLKVDQYALARGVALGLFIGLTPTVGIQIILLIFGSMIVRANFPAALVVSFVNNPFTMAPLYYGFNQLGEEILERLPFVSAEWMERRGVIAEETLEMAVGSLAIAGPAAALGYFLSVWLWRALKPKFRRRESGNGADR